MLSACLFFFISGLSMFVFRRRGLQRVCSPIRPKGATLNQAISDQKFRQLLLLHKDPPTLFTTIASHFHLSFLLPQTLCIYTTPLDFTPRPSPSFLPFSEIQSLHDTFLELRDVHPISNIMASVSSTLPSSPPILQPQKLHIPTPCHLQSHLLKLSK